MKKNDPITADNLNAHLRGGGELMIAHYHFKPRNAGCFFTCAKTGDTWYGAHLKPRSRWIVATKAGHLFNRVMISRNS